MAALYDELGRTYSSTRRPDPRVGARIAAVLSGSATVINIGAGTGSYEPPQTVVAIEPSPVMISQRPRGSAPVLRAAAEHIPLRDDCADAVLAVLTIHHWSDLERGLAEMHRIARHRLVFLTWDAEVIGERFWLLSEYLPAARQVDAEMAVPLDRLAGLLANPVVSAVPVPHDCADGFGAAFWRRPAAYLDPAVQAGMSLFAKLDPALYADGLARLADDLSSGRWQREHADLLDAPELDLGYRLVISEA
jgi:SAM-dependent methyltransferase